MTDATAWAGVRHVHSVLWRNANMKLLMAVGIGLAFALWLLVADMLRRNRDDDDVLYDADLEPQ